MFSVLIFIFEDWIGLFGIVWCIGFMLCLLIVVSCLLYCWVCGIFFVWSVCFLIVILCGVVCCCYGELSMIVLFIIGMWMYLFVVLLYVCVFLLIMYCVVNVYKVVFCVLMVCSVDMLIFSCFSNCCCWLCFCFVDVMVLFSIV